MTRFEQNRPKLSLTLQVLTFLVSVATLVWVGGYKVAVIETTQSNQAKEIAELRLRLERLEPVGNSIVEIRTDVAWIKRAVARREP